VNVPTTAATVYATLSSWTSAGWQAQNYTFVVNPQPGTQPLQFSGTPLAAVVPSNGHEVLYGYAFSGGDARTITAVRTSGVQLSGLRIAGATATSVVVGYTGAPGTPTSSGGRVSLDSPGGTLTALVDNDGGADGEGLQVKGVEPQEVTAGGMATLSISGLGFLGGSEEPADVTVAMCLMSQQPLQSGSGCGESADTTTSSDTGFSIGINVPTVPGIYCVQVTTNSVPIDWLLDEYSPTSDSFCGITVDPATAQPTVTLSPQPVTLALTPQQQSPQRQFTANGTPTGGTYSWSVGTGLTLQNVSGAQATIQATSIGTSSVNVAYTVAGGGTASGSATVNVVAPKLVSVLWGGAGKQAIVKVNTDWTQDPLDCPGLDEANPCPGYGTAKETTAIGTSSSPEWQDPNGDGAPTVTDPVAYVMGSTPMVQQAQIMMSPNLSLTAMVKVDICYFDDIGCAPYPGLAFNPAAVNFQSGVGNVQLQTTGALPSYIVNDVVQLTWRISFDGGSTYTQFAQSIHDIFTIFASSLTTSGDYWVTSLPAPWPSQLLAVTAARLNYATRVLSKSCQGGANGCLAQDQAIVNAIVDSIADFPGPDFATSYAMSPIYGNYWMMLDGSGVAADCISLAGIAGLVLSEIGIQADSHFAFPTGVQPEKLGDKDLTDAVNQTPDKTENGVDLKFVYLTTANNCENDGEGFLRATVSVGGIPTDMAWAVWPDLGSMTPVSASAVTPTETWTTDHNSYNNRLFYRVLYTVLTNELVPNTLQGLQVWTANIVPPPGSLPQLCGNPHPPPVEIVPLPVTNIN
jgi:hypothetical protein